MSLVLEFEITNARCFEVSSVACRVSWKWNVLTLSNSIV